MILENRATAADLLGKKLKKELFLDSKPLVIALPRGGVPVADRIAQILDADFDILLVKKIGMPDHEELAAAAISETGEPSWNEDVIQTLGLTHDEFKVSIENKRKEIKRQLSQWKKDPLTANKIRDREIIIADDGLATGSTMIAAIQFLKQHSPRKIIVAVPVAAKSSVENLKSYADQIIPLIVPEPFYSVGQWYKDFSQVSDHEVALILERRKSHHGFATHEITIGEDKVNIKGDLTLPNNPSGIIIFAHGSGSSRKSPRNQKVARCFNQKGFGTLLFDLLTDKESEDRRNVFNIDLLAKRLVAASDWVSLQYPSVPIGYFGASTGAAAAIGAAAKFKNIFAVVSRGGRPDLASNYLNVVEAPVLLLVGSKDTEVVVLNEYAKKHLENCEIEIIPNAGHLFEEPGALDVIIHSATRWFQTQLTMHQSGNIRRLNRNAKDFEINEIATLTNPLQEGEDFDAWVERMSKAKVVMLGEATHGTEEFYKIRRLITQKLIDEYGFKFVAVEGDWPDCYKLNRFIENKNGTNVLEVMRSFQRWPTWMWANLETAKLVKWMKGKSVGFHGLDVYSLYESLDAIKAYESKVTAEMAEKISKTFACFQPHSRDEMKYVKSLVKETSGCDSDIDDAFNTAKRLRLRHTLLEREQLFDLRQNISVIKNAEKYYRAMVYGGADSWNIRDTHMMDTLDSLFSYYGNNARGIVWAHNTHIGDYHATDMVKENYVNIGGLARERYGIENVYLVGLGTYGGEVVAGSAWGRDPKNMKLPNAKDDSYEGKLHKVCEQLKRNEIFIPMTDRIVPFSLLKRRDHRAIGVVYNPIYELHGGNYVPTDICERYDGFIFVDRTSALKYIPHDSQKGLLPETWPTGA